MSQPDPNKRPGPCEEYVSPTVRMEFLSDLGLPRYAEDLIGKTIARVEAREYSLTLHFTDGSSVSASGHRWDECCLGVEIQPAPE